MNKDLVYKKEENKCNNIIKQYKMFNFDCITKCLTLIVLKKET